MAVVAEVAGAAAGAKPDPLGVWPLQAARTAIASAVRQRVMVALDTYGGVAAAEDRC